MEDAATAEISRAQIWQWIRHGASVTMRDKTSQQMTSSLYRSLLEEETELLKDDIGKETFIHGRFPEAIKLFTQTATSADLPDFLTLSAYNILEK